MSKVLKNKKHRKHPHNRTWWPTCSLAQVATIDLHAGQWLSVQCLDLQRVWWPAVTFAVLDLAYVSLIRDAGGPWWTLRAGFLMQVETLEMC